MKMRWFLAGVAALLIVGGGATVAQRVITQKTRGVLPEKDDSAHPETRPAAQTVEVVAEPVFIVAPSAPAVVVAPIAEAPLLPAPGPAADADPPAAEARVVIATTAVVAEPATAQDPPADQGVPPQADPAVSPTTAVPEPSAPTPGPVEAPSPTPRPGAADPVTSVETFVERNRKEAETAIDTLTTEAANLKERLAKVETALARWQSFSRALNVEQPAAAADAPPATKPNWKRGTPEATSRPAPGLADPAPADAPRDAIPLAPSPAAEPGRAEPPANPPLSLPADLPEAKPSTPEPTGKPALGPPSEPPLPGSG